MATIGKQAWRLSSSVILDSCDWYTDIFIKYFVHIQKADDSLTSISWKAYFDVFLALHYLFCYYFRHCIMIINVQFTVFTGYILLAFSRILRLFSMHERQHWLAKVSLLLTLNIFHSLFFFWLQKGKCFPGITFFLL